MAYRSVGVVSLLGGLSVCRCGELVYWLIGLSAWRACLVAYRFIGVVKLLVAVGVKRLVKLTPCQQNHSFVLHLFADRPNSFERAKAK